MRTEAETRKKGREEEKKMADDEFDYQYQYHTMQPLQPTDDFENEDINVNVESENERTLSFYLKTSKFRPRLCVLNFVL